jgi:hypothetical protein
MPNEMDAVGTTVANAATTVTLTANFAVFSVTNQGSAVLYVSTDGTPASASSTTSVPVLAGTTATVTNRQGEQNLSVLSLFSTAAVPFLVVGVTSLNDLE